MWEREELKERRLGLLLGGLSAEREVSLMTAEAVAQGLREQGYEPIEIDVGRDLAQVLVRERIEVAFNALHGRYGEDGCVQGLLEVMDIPYTGSGVLASALAMSKPLSKRLFVQLGLPTPSFELLGKAEASGTTLAQLKMKKAVVKPADEGSSVGIAICESDEELARALAEALPYSDPVMVEEFVQGRELTVGILDEKVLAVLEIVPAETFYDYKAKYESHETRYLCPAPVSAPVEEQAREIAVAAHRCLHCAGVTRVDFMLDESEGLWLLEVNTLPGMTGTSLIPKMARHQGMSFGELCERILLGAALERKV